MNKAKIIFNQTLMVSTGILFCMGVRSAVLSILSGRDNIGWQWYIPLSIIFVGFLCALASLLLYDDGAGSGWAIRIRVIIHFILVFGIVSLSGYLFRWYANAFEYLIIVIMYILIYAFVWISTAWMLKADEKKINDAIDQIRDDE